VRVYGDAVGESLVGLWDGWWDTPHVPPDETTYKLAAEWLDAACADVEDWGCGGAYAKRFFRRATYCGVDGSRGPADVIADLQVYRSDVDGILLRHVLEHNRNWETILANALRSARKCLAVVVFTPLGEVTREIRWNAMKPPTPGAPDVGVPDIGFARDDLLRTLDGCAVTEATYATQSVYGAETIFYIDKASR